MKEYISAGDLAIWIALVAAQVILCLCVLKKHLVRRLVWFSLYTLASAIQSLVLFTIAFTAPYATYYHAFYLTGHITSVVAFLTLVEFGRQVLPGLNLPQKERALACLLVVVAGVIIFAWLWPIRSITYEKRIEVAACLAIAVAFIFLAAYAHYLGLRWSRLLGGVALTLGFMYLVDGITKALIGHYPSASVLKIRQFREVAKVLAVVAWIVVVVSPWGEYELTEEALHKAERIVQGAEGTLRDFAMEGSSKT